MNQSDFPVVITRQGRYAWPMFLSVLIMLLAQEMMAQMPSIEMHTVYSSPQHDAFPTLVHWQNRYYCAFRSGERHVYGRDGEIIILQSEDAENWTEWNRLRQAGTDLRDPKLSVTSDNRLMILAGGSVYVDKVLQSMQTQVGFARSPQDTQIHLLPIDLDSRIKTGKDWLWRVTWKGERAFGVVYQRGGGPTRLVSSRDGINYTWLADLKLDGRPNEATIRFADDGTMYILHRREEGDQMGYWGWSHPPYRSWQWVRLEERLGGPDFALLSDGGVIAGTRIYRPDGARMGLMWGSLKGEFTDPLLLPSGGDCSYPAILVEEDRTLVVYYAAPEGKADIYLAILTP